MLNSRAILLAIDPSVQKRLDSLTDAQVAVECQKAVNLLASIGVAGNHERQDASRNPRLVKTRIRNKNGKLQTVYVLPSSEKEQSSQRGAGVGLGVGLGALGVGALGFAALQASRSKTAISAGSSPPPASPDRFRHLPATALAAGVVAGGATILARRGAGNQESRVIQEPLISPAPSPGEIASPPGLPPSPPPSPTDPWDTPAGAAPVINPIGTGNTVTPDPWGAPTSAANNFPAKQNKVKTRPIELENLPVLEAPPIQKPAKLQRKSPARPEKPRSKVDKNLNQTEILARKGESYSIRAELIGNAKKNVSKFVADGAAIESWENSLKQIANPLAPSYFKNIAPQVAAAKKKAKSLLTELDALSARLEGRRTRTHATDSFQSDLQKIQEHATKVLSDSSDSSRHSQLEKLRKASDTVATVAAGFSEIDAMRDQVRAIADRLSKIPDKKSDLDANTYQEVNLAEKAAKKVKDLPDEIARYQSKQIDLATRAEAEIKSAQELTAKYQDEAGYAKTSVQPIIERELNNIEKNMGLMQKMAGPEGVAWVTSKSSAPPDVAIILNSDKELSAKNIKTLSEAAEFRDHVLAVLHGRINGSSELMDRSIAYGQDLHNNAVNGVRESLNRLKKIRDESFGQFSEEERLITSIRSVAADMSVGAGTGTINPYAQRANDLIQGLSDFRTSRAASISDAIANLEAIERSYGSRGYDEYEITLPRKKTPIVLESEKLRALFQASQSVALELRRPVEIEGQIVDTPERIQELTQKAERKAELNLAGKEIDRIKKELARINLQVNRQKAAQAAGDRRAKPTDRLEAERQVLLQQLRQVVDKTYPPEIRQEPDRKDELERYDLYQARAGLVREKIVNKQGERQTVWRRREAPQVGQTKARIRGFFKSPADPLADRYNPDSPFAVKDEELVGYSAASVPAGLSMNSVVFMGKDIPFSERQGIADDVQTIADYKKQIAILKQSVHPDAREKISILGKSILSVQSKIKDRDWDKLVKTQETRASHAEVWTAKIANDNGIPSQTSRVLSPAQGVRLVGSVPFGTHVTLHDRVPGVTLAKSPTIPQEWKLETGSTHYLLGKHQDLAKITALDDFILNNDRHVGNIMHDDQNNRYYSIDTGLSGAYNSDLGYFRSRALREEMAKLKAPWELRNLKIYADTMEELLNKYSPDDIVEQQRKVAQDMGEINWFYRTHLPLSKGIIEANHARNRENVQMIRGFLAAKSKKP